MFRLPERLTLCCVILFCTALPGSAEQTDGTVFDSGNKMPVKQFLTVDGSIDMDAVRQSGYQGNLDLDGFDVRLHPATGAPLLSPESPAPAAPHPDDQYWHDMATHVDGMGGVSVPRVYALTVYDNKLIAGGNFMSVDDLSTANNIAAWNGSSWETLGTGMNGSVRALAVYDNKLIVGGEFTDAGGPDGDYIVAWNGSSCEALGTGMNSSVRALTIYDNKLVAGGQFTSAGGTTALRIAAWNGSSWERLGTDLNPGMDHHVYALTVYSDKLIAGGDFTDAGGTTAWNIASWDGSSWSAMGSMPMPGTDGKIYALTVYDSKLIAGGSFDNAGLVTAHNIAAWTDFFETWSPLGSGMGPASLAPSVQALIVYDDRLIAGGWFTEAGIVSGANSVATWDGSDWSQLGGGMNSSVSALIVYDAKLIAGGWFTSAGSVTDANYIAAWDGFSPFPCWSKLKAVMNGIIHALANCHPRYTLIAGGQFTQAGGKVASNIAYWDRVLLDWVLLGSGMGGVVPWVYALVMYENMLIVGGEFATAGGLEAHFIAAWNCLSEEWSIMGTGMDGPVTALAIYDSKVIVGGFFSTAGGTAVNNIAAWDGYTSAWSPLGPGLSGGSVSALTVYDGELIAGGVFTTAGATEVNHIAAWDGSTWSPLGSGMDSWVSALTVYEDELIAGGAFTTADGTPANYIAAWNGSYWSPLGDGMNSYVYAFTIRPTPITGTQLIAGGLFTTAGGMSANYIAAWDASSGCWSPLGSGMDAAVTALTVYESNVIAGGAFTTAGGKEAPYIARWTKMYFTCGDVDGAKAINILDVTYIVNYLYKNGPAPVPEQAADTDGSGGINILDVTHLVNYLYKNGPDPIC